MYLKSTEHTLCIYFDFVLRSEWSLINIPGTMGVGPNKLLVVKGLILVGYCILPDAIRPYVRKKTIRVLCVADMGGVGMRVSAVKHNKVYYPSPNKTNKKTHALPPYQFSFCACDKSWVLQPSQTRSTILGLVSPKNL